MFEIVRGTYMVSVQSGGGEQVPGIYFMAEAEVSIEKIFETLISTPGG